MCTPMRALNHFIFVDTELLCLDQTSAYVKVSELSNEAAVFDYSGMGNYSNALRKWDILIELPTLVLYIKLSHKNY